MSVDFIPRPPRSLCKIPRSERRRNLKRLIARFPAIVRQALTPFDDKPTEPSPLPQDEAAIPAEQVEHCEWIFDQAEQRATSLEQKAQWTFGLIAFLAPLLAGSFVFFIKEPTEEGIYKNAAIMIVSLASVLLLLGFICALRAVSVSRRETLFIASALDMTTGEFLKYDNAFRARGLLYCASMNTAMNDHIANFVKAAHIFSAIAVVLLVVAAIPASLGFSSRRATLIDAKVISPVAITSKELSDLDAQVASLRSDLAARERANDSGQQQWFGTFEARMTKVENQISDLGRAIAILQTNKAPYRGRGHPSPR
jgi:hypothetical protein